MRHTTVLAALEASAASVLFSRDATKDKSSSDVSALSWDAFVDWSSTRDFPYFNARVPERFAGATAPEQDS